MKAQTLLFVSFLLIISASAQKSVLDLPSFEQRTLLFSGPDSISKFYRIPAIATLADGTVVAVADRRLDSNKDLPGNIDVVCRRSFDKGNTWTDVTVVAAHDKGGGYGDPALGVDPASGDLVCVMTHGEGLWEAVPGSHAYITVSRSSDGGATWSAPQDITPNLFSQTAGEAPIQAISAFATSGKLLTTRDGDMWFVLVARPDIKKWSKLCNYVCHSSDGGHSWEAYPTTVDTDADESKLVELPDGKLLMSIRNRRKGYRKFAVSEDRGKTWSNPVKSTTLPDPACNGEIISLADGTLLHSINDSHTERTAVSLFASRDNGNTWSKICELCPTWSVYSTMCLLDEHTLGILCEEGSSEGGLRLWFTRLNLDRLQ